MSNIPNKFVIDDQKQAAFNADAALYNLQNALRCQAGGWERESYLAHAIIFQMRAAKFAKEARISMGLE